MKTNEFLIPKPQAAAPNALKSLDSSPAESSNPELRDLNTHASGAVELHETIETVQPVSIEQPNGGHPGPYDVREDRFQTEDAAHASSTKTV